MGISIFRLSFARVSVCLLLANLDSVNPWELLSIPSDAADFQTSGVANVVDISNTGRRIAVGSPDVSDGSGVVRIYDIDAALTTWNLISTIEGEPSEHFGDSLSLSPDGNLLAVRRRHVSPNGVQVYRLPSEVGNMHRHVGSFIQCPANGTEVSFGQSVQYTATEYFVAISCESYNNDRGLVQVFKLDNNQVQEWQLHLPFLTGESSGDGFGSSTAIIGAYVFGRPILRLAISSPTFDGGRGRVKIFHTENSEWSQLGNDLVGSSVDEGFGSSLDISGTTNPYIVVGSPNKRLGSSLAPHGMVQLFHWRSLEFGASASWTLIGVPHSGVSAGDEFGRSVSLSGAGDRFVAASCARGELAGYMRVYDRDTYDSSKIVHHQDILPSESGTFVSSVVINRQGSVVLQAPSVLAESDETGHVHVWLDDAPFCHVPTLDTTVVQRETYFSRNVCRRGGNTLYDLHECVQSFVIVNGRQESCEWASILTSTPTASPTKPQESSFPSINEAMLGTDEPTPPTREPLDSDSFVPTVSSTSPAAVTVTTSTPSPAPTFLTYFSTEFPTSPSSDVSPGSSSIPFSSEPTALAVERSTVSSPSLSYLSGTPSTGQTSVASACLCDVELQCFDTHVASQQVELLCIQATPADVKLTSVVSFYVERNEGPESTFGSGVESPLQLEQQCVANKCWVNITELDEAVNAHEYETLRAYGFVEIESLLGDYLIEFDAYISPRDVESQGHPMKSRERNFFSATTLSLFLVTLLLVLCLAIVAIRGYQNHKT